MNHYPDITGRDVIAKVRTIAAEQPDFVYQGIGSALRGQTCFYWSGRGPSCIFGRALHALGVRPDDLEAADTAGIGAVGLSIAALVARFGIEADDIERGWMTEVQFGQDKGRPWGQAVESADRFYSELVLA